MRPILRWGVRSSAVLICGVATGQFALLCSPEIGHSAHWVTSFQRERVVLVPIVQNFAVVIQHDGHRHGAVVVAQPRSLAVDHCDAAPGAR